MHCAKLTGRIFVITPELGIDMHDVTKTVLTRKRMTVTKFAAKMIVK